MNASKISNQFGAFCFFLADVAFDNQLGFQDPASPIVEGIIDLHHDIFFFLVLIIIFVL
jgi:hypothetical protein